MDMGEEILSELEDIAIEISKAEKQTEGKRQQKTKTEQNIQGLQNNCY